ncbi:hypothetical protein [Pseudomonas sp. GL-R-26]|uniref:hypothetical protein n=1 Tax=Pseudomonas sp. GL-R-26 TaxID=2832392 RepID=UPI001CBE7A70|nr:hypothetical protein [Pseudomonas sp. GL-R-26]
MKINVQTPADNTPFLDPSFGQNGKIIHMFPGTTTSHVAGMAMNANGKIIVSATTYGNDDQQFGLMRLNEDGNVDTQFGGSGSSGYIRGNFLPGVRALGGGVSVLPDEKILLSGFNYGEQGYQHVLARFNDDGTPDTEFGKNGQIIIDLPLTEPLSRTQHNEHAPTAFSIADSATVQSDGTILLTVHAAVKGQDGYGIVMRFLANGVLDTSFNNSGSVKLKFDGYPVTLSRHALQADGKILVFGGVQKEFEHGLLARLDIDGQLDTSFGAGGFTTISYPKHLIHCNQVSIKPDGRLVAIGIAYTYAEDGLGTNDCMVMGFTTDGRPDTAFNEGKPVITQPRPKDCYWLGGASSIDDTTTTIGNAHGRSGSGHKSEFLVGRYLANGRLDLRFANGIGWRTISVFGIEDAAKTYALLPDGKLLIAGNSWVSTSHQMSFVRLANGRRGQIAIKIARKLEQRSDDL